MSFPGSPFVIPTAITIKPNRNVDGIKADATLEEIHSDRLTITKHPVEQGAMITDHAFKEPARLILRYGFSNSSSAAGYDADYVNNTYANFLDLQEKRTLFSVITGKRTYDNMLLENIDTTTDSSTEFSLIITLTCQQIIIVSTKTTTVPPAAQQKDPASNSPPVNNGQKQLSTAPSFNSGG